jgi:class 3 adenylate cyclase
LSQRVHAAIEKDAEASSVGELTLKGVTRPVRRSRLALKGFTQPVPAVRSHEGAPLTAQATKRSRGGSCTC